MKEATKVVTPAKKVVIAVTGGISAYKVPEVIRILKRNNIEVRVVATTSALNFVGEATWSAISGQSVITSLWDETENVSHVDLAKKTDLVAIVPATADTISDLANSKANSAVSALALTTNAPIFVFPAMHTQMWEHSGTQENIKILRERGIQIFDPEVGELTSSDQGVGRLLEPKLIASIIMSALLSEKKLRVLISSGGTKEPIDPVRYLTNNSSGKQGVALAKVATQRGLKTTLITTKNQPGPWTQIQVSSASEMHSAMLKEFLNHDIVIMAAAVADWTPKTTFSTKAKKTLDNIHLELVPTKDILSDLTNKSDGERVFVGFAAETISNSAELVHVAREKLKRKQLDLICANDVSQGAIFDSESTHLHLVDSRSHRDLGETTKIQAAEEILNAAVEIYQRKYPEN